MKIRSIILCALAACMAFLQACKKDQIQEDSYPAAKISLTGAQNIVEVPMASYANYELNEAEKKLYITLGISRSGFEDNTPFTVKVAANPDTVQQLINNGGLQNTLPMTADMYELPSEVSVSGDASGALLRISVDVEKVKSISKKLALAVTISQPSAFEINPALKTAIVVLNYRKVSGILHPNDAPATGRIFETYTTQAAVDAWSKYNHAASFIDAGKIKLVQGNIDGYGITARVGVTYNLDTHRYLAIRVSEQPTGGAWLFKSWTGIGDMVARPSSASVEVMPDNSRIFYWDMHALTTKRGIVTDGNYQIATEGANGKTLVVDWIKSFKDEAEVKAYAEEER
jgi:hypothetical protein